LVGAALIAINLVVIGRKIEDKASNVVFDGLKRREDYEKDMSRENPFCMRAMAFVKYNAPYLIVILLWVIWLIFIIIWSIIATNEDGVDPEHRWGFAYAQYFGFWSLLLGFYCVLVRNNKEVLWCSLLQISIHLQQMGKIGPFGKSRKVFWHIQNGPKGFLGSFYAMGLTMTKSEVILYYRALRLGHNMFPPKEQKEDDDDY
jgi:hypothetical protein